MKLQVQTLLNNRYRITAFLSQGGFGYTYLADDDLFGKKVCIKELYINNRSTRGPRQEVITEDSSDFSFEHFSTRFWEEAKQLAAFDHPNIVKVKDFFKSNGSTYFVMEYIEGETLQAKKLKGELNDEQRIFAVMTQLLAAVETVHNAGMLHRDIKPENILIANDNRVVLIDFGSARDFEDGKTLAHTTLISPGYAPIEQYSNRAKRGAYTDIYALGATLYFLLTGQKPLPATDRYREQLPSPQQLNPAISTQLSSAVMMAMAMEPEDRFQSVADFKAALLLSGKNVEKTVVTEILPQKEIANKEKTPVVQSPAVEEKPVKKSNTLFYGGMAVLLLALVGFLVWGRADTTDQTYCQCYETLADKINNQQTDSLKVSVYDSGVKECEKNEKKDKDCKAKAELEKTIAPVKEAEAKRLRSEKLKMEEQKKKEDEKKKKEKPAPNSTTDNCEYPNGNGTINCLYKKEPRWKSEKVKCVIESVKKGNGTIFISDIVDANKDGKIDDYELVRTVFIDGYYYFYNETYTSGAGNPYKPFRCEGEKIIRVE
jgi:serine/threonine protein kinase